MIHHQIPWQKYPYITILSQYTTTGMHNYEEIYVNFAVPLAFFYPLCVYWPVETQTSR